jgi:hypothetical protein
LGGHRELVQYADLLLTLAEVSVAIAGFSGVVIVLGNRQKSVTRRISAIMTQGMVIGGLQAVVISILPILLSESGLEPQTAWRVACVLFGLIYAAGTAYFFVRTARLDDYQRQHTAAGPSLFFLSAGASMLLLTAGAGAFGSFASGVYMACLLFHLSVTAFGFLRLLSAQLSDDEG